MRWVRETPRFLAQLAERHPWLFVWPRSCSGRCCGRWRSCGWRCGISIATGHWTRARRPSANAASRRLLRWYPADWRARYGDEMAALLHDTIAAGRDGPQAELERCQRRTGGAAGASRASARAGGGLPCAVLDPALPAGTRAGGHEAHRDAHPLLVPGPLLPDAYQWPLIVAMIALGWRCSAPA